MKLVDDDYDTGSYFVVDENGEGCGGRLIEDELWERYQAAEDVVDDIKAEMEACKFVPYPVPAEGTLACTIHDYYADMAREMMKSHRLFFRTGASDEDALRRTSQTAPLRLSHVLHRGLLRSGRHRQRSPGPRLRHRQQQRQPVRPMPLVALP